LRKDNLLSASIEGKSLWRNTVGLAEAVYLKNPYGVAVNALGNLYIADSDNYVVRKVTFSTGVTTIVVGTGNHGYSGDNGLATLAQLSEPYGIAVDASR
jgi:hypothetical protein